MIFILACLMLSYVQADGDRAESFVQTTFHVEYARQDSHLEEIVEVINKAYQRQAFNRKDCVRMTFVELQEILSNTDCHLFLLCQGPRICGTLLLKKSEISLFSLHPDFQGHGYGSLLLTAAEKEAFQNYDYVTLKMIPLFQEKLRAYYERQGYEALYTEELSSEKFERIEEQYHTSVEALVMKKNRPNS